MNGSEGHGSARPTFVITGASGGLGSFLVEDLRDLGDVIATYRSRPRTASHNEGLRWCHLDVSNGESVAQFVDTNKARLRRVVLLNLAAVSIDGMAHKLSESQFDHVMATNLKGSFLMCRALLPMMRAERWGRIINVSSVVSHLGIVGTVAYAASKAALHAMTRTIAVENAMKGVTVNTIALGYFDAGMMYALSPESQERIKAGIPMQRLGRPAEFRDAIEFIVKCGYLTGTTIDLNGGLR